MTAETLSTPCVLITGGSGFVGKHLIRFLKPHTSRIVVLSTGTSVEPEPEVEYREVDVRQREAVTAIVNETNPQHVYHLAGITAVDASWRDPRLTFEVNVLGALNVFEAAMQLASPPRILNVSSSQVYAPSNQPLNEQSVIRPENPYAASKAMAELLAVQYRNAPSGGIISARPFNHTGPGQSPNFVLSSIAQQFAEIEAGLRGPKLELGNIEVKRDFSDVRDVVRAYWLLLEKGRPGEVYNVCSGRLVDLHDAIKIFCQLVSAEVTIETDATKVRSNDAEVMWGDQSKICGGTGWSAQIPLAKTLEDLLDYWRQRLHRPIEEPIARV